MPKLIELYGYSIYFYSNEQGEPCHVHITRDYKANSKIWIEPEVKVANNDAKIPAKDWKKILRWAEDNSAEILARWQKYFN